MEENYKTHRLIFVSSSLGITIDKYCFQFNPNILSIRTNPSQTCCKHPIKFNHNILRLWLVCYFTVEKIFAMIDEECYTHLQ